MEKHGPGQAAKPPAPSWTTAVAQPAAARSSVAALAARDLRKNRGKRVVLDKKQSKMVKMEKHGGFTMFYMIIIMFCWHQRKSGG